MGKTVISICVCGSFFVFAGFTHAQGYTPLVDLPGVTTVGTPTNMSAYLSGAIKLLIALGAAFSVLMAIIGGTQYVASGIAPSAKNDAKERITNALIGLILILTSYLILNSINPNLVAFNLGLPPVGVAPANVLAPEEHVTLIPLTHQVNTFIHPTTSTTPVASTGSVFAPVAPASSVGDQSIDRNNDYSIISHCAGNTTYDLCPKTDLNKDGTLDAQDFSLFISKGALFDVNRNKILELAALPTPASCFFKTSTTNVQAILPKTVKKLSKENEEPSGVCGGTGTTLLPTIACNGGAWVKASFLGSACASGATPFNSIHPALRAYKGNGPYDVFSNWITISSSGGAVNLSTLFEKTFFGMVPNGDHPDIWGYKESEIGKITYATVAQYDLNDDGLADFSAGGTDMAVFNACKGAVSASCVQADFNGDGVVDDRDIAMSGTIQHPVLGSMVDLVGNHLSIMGMNVMPSWTLGDFESYFFDSTGYSDKQIINYWIGRKAVYGKPIGDLNNDNMVNSLDLGAFNTGAPPLDFNGDGKVDLAL